MWSMILKFAKSALKIIGKVVGALVKVISHAVQVHKEKKAAAAAAQAKAAQVAKQKEDSRRSNIIKIVAGLVIAGTLATVVYFVYTGSEKPKAKAA